jgi:hypothetical protein
MTARGDPQEEWVQLPSHVLPPPVRASLPPAAPLRAMLGPSLILAGLSIGSGEFVLWPRLTAEHGLGLFWACWIGVTLQFFLNLEIERYTLATGESAVVGFVRLARAFAWVFLLCGSVPWIWPGWATGAAALVAGERSAAAPWLAVAGLVACGLVLSVGPVVYRTLERLQALLVAVIFALLGLLTAVLVTRESLLELWGGAWSVGSLPEGLDLPLFFGAVAFAGAGGSVNLAQSNYVKDKGYGMGRFIGRITSPFTGREEAISEVGVACLAEPGAEARWRAWWWRSNVEHFASFHLLCLLSLAMTSLIAHELLAGRGDVAPGLGFVFDEARLLEERFGPWARQGFLAAGVAVLLSTELALLDAVSRVVADLASVSFLRDRGVSLSRVYFASVWGLVAFGAAVLAVGVEQPLALLVLSSCLNGVVMFLYSGLLLWLGLASFRGPLRPSPLRIAALLAALGFYGTFSVLTLASELRRLSGAA